MKQILKKTTLFVLFLSFTIAPSLFAQETFPVYGISNPNNNLYAFTNAHIFLDYQTEINGTVIIQDRKIIAAGNDISIPPEAQIIDLKGKYIYPSFIDPFSDYGMPEIKKNKEKKYGPQFERKTKGPVAWNDALKPRRLFAEEFSVNDKQADKYRQQGFGTVITHQKDGIIRGISATVLLGNRVENLEVVKSKTALQFSFNKGSSTQDYPGSLMGAIALLRQTYLDAFWYANNTGKKERNIDLEAFIEAQNLPQIFEVNNYQSLLRADKVGDEFQVQYIIKGGGDEYKRIDEIKKTGAALIIPVNFPDAYDVEDPFDAEMVTLSDLKHWELAPFNPVILEKNNIDFAFTADGLKDKTQFLKNVRTAISKGLSKTTALKALTYNPALIIGEDASVGKIAEGFLANLLITSGDIFEDTTIIYENIIAGQRFIYHDINFTDIRGVYDLNINGKIYQLHVEGDLEKPTAKIQIDTTRIKATLELKGNLVTLSFKQNDAFIRLSGKINFNSGIWDGKGVLPDAQWVNWNAIRKQRYSEKSKNRNTAPDTIIPPVFFPNMAYGWDTLPNRQTYLIKNATLWTCEAEGVMKNADLLIQNGKIAQIGYHLEQPEGAVVIDATGKHVTPGIIDEHSHIAISGGVNECTEAITAEVRIGDVINPDDINIYRQLAGGVTAAQLLHGSCNPIGGQSALIKLRWGQSAEAMKIKNADGFIKFALGENVKRANFGDFYTKRYPQTRMGVEQIYYDAFYRAKSYRQTWEKYSSVPPKKRTLNNLPRKDLELETLVEILDKKRFITCHSYQQGEI
ncbi:MAG: amidohydrolase, partial [Bacteroidetes bacterium]